MKWDFSIRENQLCYDFVPLGPRADSKLLNSKTNEKAKFLLTTNVTSFSVFHAEATVSIGLKNVHRMVTSILQN